MWAGWRSWYRDWLRAGRSGDRIPVGGEILHACPDRPWGPPSLLYNGYRVFPGVKSGRGVKLTPHPLLVPQSRKIRAISLLPLWAVRPVQSLSACTTVYFAFTYTSTLPTGRTACTEPQCLYKCTRVHFTFTFTVMNG